MTGTQIKRKLVAVLAADVAGYSRMMAADEAGTHLRLRNLYRDVLRPAVARGNGRIFKTMGDGAMVEFASVQEAVSCAREVLATLKKKPLTDHAGEAIRMRIGVSLGDVIFEGNDLFGNGVNIAARMESLAEPGTICISANVREHLTGMTDMRQVDLGPCKVKNIPEPVHVYQLSEDVVGGAGRQSPVEIQQDIRFCRSADGTQIAYAMLGQGSPVVNVSNWLTHLELDLQIPMRRALVEELTPGHALVRYDARGSGLSDRDIQDLSLDASVADLLAVLDDLKLDRVALIGQSQGAAIAAAFAARFPDRVDRLVLCGGYARGRRMRGSEGQIAESDAFITMIRQGWGKGIDAYVRMFGAFFMPDAGAEQLNRFTELQRKATPPENAARIQLAIDSIDITEELHRIQAPTLVFHVREDARAPFDEGRRMAAGIPNARFIPLEGRNHVMLSEEPSLRRFLDELKFFLAG